MPCESIGVVWENECLVSSSDLSYQNFSSFCSFNDHRLGSVSTSQSSDSEASMALDSEEEFDIGNYFTEEQVWDDQSFAPTQPASTLSCNNNAINTYNVIPADVSMNVYGSVSACTSSFTEISPCSYPQTSSFTPSSSYTVFNNEHHLNTSPTSSQAQVNVNLSQCSPTSNAPVSSQNWSRVPQQLDSSQGFPENELEISDTEDTFSNEFEYQPRGGYELKLKINPCKREELPTIRSMLCEKIHCTDQQRCPHHQLQQSYHPSRLSQNGKH